MTAHLSPDSPNDIEFRPPQIVQFTGNHKI
jgi:hypothetical protein